MRARLIDLLASLRASYWFLPSLMMLATFLLAAITVRLDGRIDFATLGLPLVVLSQSAGARTLLGTLAGSMLSVASLTFSIVMVVLTMASSQFGPRLLGNFMRDRGNQVVLGAFVSTFLYCLLVLRTVRGDGAALESVFVPHLSVTVALVLAVVNLGAFVYFIHHTTESVQAANVIARVSRSLERKLLERYEERPIFPEPLGSGPDGDADEAADEPGEAAALPSERGGYLRAVDDDGLLALAVERDLRLELPHAPGAYVMHGAPLVRVWPAAALDDCRDELAGKFAIGDQRTGEQDLDFLFEQLLEVALRALSPGVNDPVTAMMCVDRIADNLGLLLRRRIPSPRRYDDDGALRVTVPVIEPSDLLTRMVAPIRSYGEGDAMVLGHLLAALRELRLRCDDAAFRARLREQADEIRAAARRSLTEEDARRVLERDPE